MAKQIKTDQSILLAEYSEAGNAMRAHADTRWKLLGVVIPISGGVLALSIQFPELSSVIWMDRRRRSMRCGSPTRG